MPQPSSTQPPYQQYAFDAHYPQRLVAFTVFPALYVGGDGGEAFVLVGVPEASGIGVPPFGRGPSIVESVCDAEFADVSDGWSLGLGLAPFAKGVFDAGERKRPQVFDPIGDLRLSGCYGIVTRPVVLHQTGRHRRQLGEHLWRELPRRRGEPLPRAFQRQTDDVH